MGPGWEIESKQSVKQESGRGARRRLALDRRSGGGQTTREKRGGRMLASTSGHGGEGGADQPRIIIYTSVDLSLYSDMYVGSRLVDGRDADGQLVSSM